MKWNVQRECANGPIVLSRLKTKFLIARSMCLPSRQQSHTFAAAAEDVNYRNQDQRPLAINYGRRLRRGDHSRGLQPHLGANRKIRAATRPRALRPAWKRPHRPIMRRVSAVAAPGGVFIRGRLTGIITTIV